jgi:lysophospholipase L1-like esterase
MPHPQDPPLAPTPLAGPSRGWSTVWTASAQGPYPAGNPSSQPDMSLAFPSPGAGARDQSFRLILRPDLWGRRLRLRFSNAFGDRPLRLEDAFVGVQLSGSALIPGTNLRVGFGGGRGAVVEPGASIWSDPVQLPYGTDASFAAGRKLAVSFHVVGESGPMTWHAKALTTSYVSVPGAGSLGREEAEAAFPFPVASWFFLDAADMETDGPARTIVAFGDSIADGSGSTMNGDDRWPDVLSRRLHARFGARCCVANAGIGGNQVVGPASYSVREPFPGGPSALSRLDRDVLSLSNVAAVIWGEGINDFSDRGGASAEEVIAGYREGVARIRSRLPGVRVVGATLVSGLGSTIPGHGSADQDRRRRTLNEFIRSSEIFDAVADFDAATIDPETGRLKAAYVPNSTVGGAGDGLHPNRLGYLAMGACIDLDSLLGPLEEHR